MRQKRHSLQRGPGRFLPGPAGPVHPGWRGRTPRTEGGHQGQRGRTPRTGALGSELCCARAWLPAVDPVTRPLPLSNCPPAEAAPQTSGARAGLWGPRLGRGRPHARRPQTAMCPAWPPCDRWGPWGPKRPAAQLPAPCPRQETVLTWAAGHQVSPGGKMGPWPLVKPDPDCLWPLFSFPLVYLCPSGPTLLGGSGAVATGRPELRRPAGPRWRPRNQRAEPQPSRTRFPRAQGLTWWPGQKEKPTAQGACAFNQMAP